VETINREGNSEKKPRTHQPEVHEGVPQHHHCPFAKHREDRNPKNHKEQQKRVAEILAAHPPKTVEREHNDIVEHNCHNAMNESQMHPC
jgi:hypothetical protein